ncbi:MAG: hypothetical protein MI747_15480 [Desulfobacterales bacterium]|nr:hypothetical protein [Desulfobacterales bacterium]
MRILPIKNTPIYLTIYILYFLGCYGLAMAWYNKGFFSVYNIFFDTDPNTTLQSFAHAWGRHAVSHPIIELFAIPIRILEIIVSRLGFISDRIQFREIIALGICPFISTLSIHIFYKLLMEMNLKTDQAISICAIYGLSFSNLMFAVLPETYALSSFFILTLFYYYLRNRNRDYDNTWIWYTIGVFLAGITITNGWIFFIVTLTYFIRAKKCPPWTSLKKTILRSFFVLITIYSYFFGAHFLLDASIGNEGQMTWILQHSTLSLAKISNNALNFFTASIQAIFVIGSQVSSHAEGGIYFNAFSFVQPGPYRFLGIAGWMVMAIIIPRIHSPKMQFSKLGEMRFLSASVITFNFCLHSVFGQETFMYTQHWIVPLFLLITPWLSEKRKLMVLVIITLFCLNLNFFLNAESLINMTPCDAT